MGLVINPRWPQLGASPDKIVYCECCLGGALEVKCPYLLNTKDINDVNEYVKLKNSCVIVSDGQIILKHDHQYYYQVQMQIFVCNLQYCVSFGHQGFFSKNEFIQILSFGLNIPKLL